MFWVENQGAWRWGADLGEPDPWVYAREGGHGAGWAATGERLSAFLLHLTVWEAIWGAGYLATALGVPPAAREQVLAPMRPLPMPEWHWPGPGFRLYAGDGLLASCLPEAGAGNTTCYEMAVTALDSRGLDYLDTVSDVSWER